MAGISMISLCLVLTFASTMGTDYCHLSSCGSGQHTVCKFPSPTPARACGKVIKVDCTAEEKTAIVNKHNELRQKVASGQETRGSPGPQPGGNLPPLTWDNELAMVAQRWANQCQFAHDQCRNVERFAVGQNIAYKGSTGELKNALTSMVQSWYDEVAHFNRNQVSKFQFSMATGHYTQIVWGKTTKVGCGCINYQDGQWLKSYLVCNYGPAGNFIGERMY